MPKRSAPKTDSNDEATAVLGGYKDLSSPPPWKMTKGTTEQNVASGKAEYSQDAVTQGEAAMSRLRLRSGPRLNGKSQTVKTPQSKNLYDVPTSPKSVPTVNTISSIRKIPARSTRSSVNLKEVPGNHIEETLEPTEDGASVESSLSTRRHKKEVVLSSRTANAAIQDLTSKRKPGRPRKRNFAIKSATDQHHGRTTFQSVTRVDNTEIEVIIPKRRSPKPMLEPTLDNAPDRDCGEATSRAVATNTHQPLATRNTAANKGAPTIREPDQEHGPSKKLVITNHISIPVEQPDGHLQDEEYEEDSQSKSGEIQDEYHQAILPQKADDIFKAAAKLHHCDKNWDALLGAVGKFPKRPGIIRTTQVEEFTKVIKKVKLAYGEILSGHADASDTAEQIEDDLDEIRVRVGEMRQYEFKQEQCLIKDIYLHAIPSLLSLLMKILVTRAREGALDRAALEELIKALGVAHKLCEKAVKWDPRPVLEMNVKQQTRNVIKTSLQALGTAYEEGFRTIFGAEAQSSHEKQRVHPSHATRHIEVQEQEEKKQDMAKHRRQVDEDLDDFERSRKEAELRHYGLSRQNGVQTGPHMVRVKDFTSDGNTSPPEAGQTSSSCKGIGVTASRTSNSPMHHPITTLSSSARPSAEETEDIPVPMERGREWEAVENEALIDGLMQHSGPDRYLNIISSFGCDDDILKDRDVDDLMDRAMFIKKSLASELEKPIRAGSDGWDWLRSVGE